MKKITVKPVGSLLVWIGLVGVIMVFTFSTTVKTCNKEAVRQVSVELAEVKVPSTVDFAGERVPVENFDIREALERELYINAYWHSQTLVLLKKSARFFCDIEPILKKYHLPDDLKYLALAESGFANISSPAGASGFWQFVPSTAKEYNLEVNSEVDERYNLEKATEAACKFLQKSYNIYKTWTMAAASYNVGLRGLSKQIQRQHTDNYYDLLLNEETGRYVFRIVALKLIVSDPAKYGFKMAKEDYYQPIPHTDITINRPIKDLAAFAFDKKTNYKILKMLNPWLRDNVLTNASGKTYTLKIPKQGVRKLVKEISREELDRIMKQSEESSVQ
ncbi:MAG: transglycosylase SLT domain-containing protein [Bacteroidota bacterium]|nr:transglycosylase SLT domain-containing protein [Bacteroidota bacterium]